MCIVMICVCCSVLLSGMSLVLSEVVVFLLRVGLISIGVVLRVWISLR